MRVLRVYPNPWAATDKEGTPCGVCPRDPESDAGGPGRFVGARVCPKATQVLQDFGPNAQHELRSPMQLTRYEYMGVASADPMLAAKLSAKGPIELPVTKFYKDRLAEGALLAADAETARAGRVRGYVDVKLVFAAHAPKVVDAAPAPAVEPAPSNTQEPALPPLALGGVQAPPPVNIAERAKRERSSKVEKSEEENSQ